MPTLRNKHERIRILSLLEQQQNTEKEFFSPLWSQLAPIIGYRTAQPVRNIITQLTQEGYLDDLGYGYAISDKGRALLEYVS